MSRQEALINNADFVLYVRNANIYFIRKDDLGLKYNYVAIK